jgi:hypothetical protein
VDGAQDIGAVIILALVIRSQPFSSKGLWAAEESPYDRLGGTYLIAVVVTILWIALLETAR